MISADALKKYEIDVPDGKVCDYVEVRIPRSARKPKIVRVDDGKKLDKLAKKVHGTELHPSFVSPDGSVAF